MSAGLLAGLGLGVGVVLSYWHPAEPLFYLWAPLAIALAASAGLAPAAGLSSVARLERMSSKALQPPTSRWSCNNRLSSRTTAVVAAALLVVNLPWVVPGSDSIAQNAILISATVLAGAPMALAMLGVRTCAGEAHGGAGERIELLQELRRIARSLVMGGGALTALVTLQGGVIMSLQRQLDAAYGRPQAFALVIGAVGTVLVGGLYVVTRGALQRAALDVTIELTSLTRLTAGEDIERALSSRRVLLEALEADRSLLSDLQADLIVLAPLLASAAAVVLPR